MKTILPLFLILLVFSCTKPNSSQDVTTSGTGEYIIFTLEGDSFNQEKFVMDRDIKKSQGKFSGNKSYISFTCPANGFDISAFFSLTLKTKGSIGLDSLSNTSVLLLSDYTKGQYFLKSFTGELTYTHYPDVINDYVKGSFSGTYFDIYGQRLFTITNGSFRIRRSE